VIPFPRLERELTRFRDKHPTIESLRKVVVQEDESLEKLKQIVDPNTVLQKYQFYLKYQPALSEEDLSYFALDFVRDRVKSAYNSAIDKVNKDFLENIGEGVPLIELGTSYFKWIDQFFQEFESHFRNDPFLEEVGKQLDIPGMVQRAKEEAVKLVNNEPPYRTNKGEQAKKAMQQWLDFFLNLDAREVFSRNGALKRFIELPPKTKPPFYPDRIAELTEQLEIFIPTESHAFLDESL